MLRIFFTNDDVARTRIAPAPDPLWELMMSMHLLRPQPGDLLFRGWRRSAAAALRDTALGERLHLLLALMPHTGYFPDFLNPSAAINGLEDGLEAVRSTPKAALGRDLRVLAGSRALPAGARELADGSPARLTELTDTMRTCYRLAVLPYRRTIEAAVDRDRRSRTRALADGGIEGLLASMRPTMTWNAGELRIPSHRDQELHLNGRGLLLVPSYFCLNGPVTMFDPALPPVVVYAVAKQPGAFHTQPPLTSSSLAALVGSTRAMVLGHICESPTTTSDIARRVGISVGSASEHTTVLRQAGLVASHRDRHRVMHHATPLGMALHDHDHG